MNEQNWNTTVTFTPDVTPIESRQGQPGNGFYKVRCTDAIFYPAKDKKVPAVRVMLTITEAAGDSAEMGNTLEDWVRLPGDSQTPEKRATTQAFLKGTLIALGHDREQVMSANGDIGLGRDSFVGKEGCMFYEAWKGDGTNSNVTWLKSEHYERGLRGEFKVKLQNAQASSIDAPAAPAAGFGGGINVTTGNVAAPPLGGNNAGAGDKIAALLS
tara:strand:- start:304 stop:945 length:642 start_codon:yes stop_codon:yes gene_type:complete